MELIPAIDIIDGKCVRLMKGDFNRKTVYNDNPLEVAKGFEDAGLKRLHIVDLDGANGDALKNILVLERIAANTSLSIDFGGGLKRTDDVKSVFDAGASMISVGSVAVNRPDLFAQWVIDFGVEKFLPGADVLDKKIKIHGWKEETGLDIFDFIKSLIHLNIQTIFCTDISKDGMMQGPSVELYKEILNHFPSLHLIASGGISCYEDLLTLKEAGCSGAIIGKAFYEEKITMPQVKEYLNN
ncbi:MAG: 1-(5-phosphoribosyl)-5-[(5-phosphoribosylamino)methylideneamino]imidazole-4-carboxamide isomerase [Bacteroidota bacterium]|nr:1-(5-phosphoribosyl)-5-[(5-phosphoribosylamino)methylideneamino]imidazole-4-carboxamide isomerase [Bacteroidota bacterium]